MEKRNREETPAPAGPDPGPDAPTAELLRWIDAKRVELGLRPYGDTPRSTPRMEE